MSTWKTYFTPTTKRELIKALRPHWNGKMTDLHQSSLKRLRGIYKTTMDRKLMEISRGDRDERN